MRLTVIGATLALGAMACGGKKADQAQTQAAAQPAAEAAPAAPAGPVVEVKMTGTGTTAAFEPKELNIAAGTTVRFINVSGGPHNISFWSDSIPAGAADVLKKAMPEQLADLEGKLLVQPNDHYDVSFAGAPAGVYKGYCMPHLALGMRINITVK
ncbi:MAG TPA: plastocyanin/azurin family copper-binding protein [Gemmatimonadales bacterium]|nr:plastocyanin/azurin family copper-binding protein [Gemmatimonadales bacterium]